MLHRLPRRPGFPVAAAALAALLVGTTCSFPTDKSDQVVVTLKGPSGVVIRGDQLVVSARAVRLSGVDTVEVKNITFRWTTSNATVATVKDIGFGSAEVTGVRPGAADISAEAVAFEGAATGYLPLRVANPLEVDSVRPKLVRFGDTLTVYGVGVDSILLASLGPADLYPYPFSARKDTTASGDTTGLARIKFWVPPPAHTDSLLFIGNGVFGRAKDTTRVAQFDIYEPNDTTPRLLDLEAARPFPQAPAFLVLNPALAFEQLARDDSLGADWYRLRQTMTRDLTVILTSPTVAGGFFTFLTDSLYFDAAVDSFRIGSDAWTIGPRSHACHGLPFAPKERLADSTVVALAGMPAGVLDAISVYFRPGAYGLAVIEGYVVTDAATAPRDAHEEDDFCSAADAPAKRVTLPFRDTLTIDNPHDVDWFRFNLPGPQAVRLRTVTVGPPATTAADSTRDLDVYLMRVPGAADTALAIVRVGTTTGPNEDVNVLLLPAGDYYAVVVDFAGVATAYDLCIGSCAIFPAAPLRAGATPRARGKTAPGGFVGFRRSPSEPR